MLLDISQLCMEVLHTILFVLLRDLYFRSCGIFFFCFEVVYYYIEVALNNRSNNDYTIEWVIKYKCYLYV